MNLSISFEPLVSWPIVAVAALAVLAIALAGLVRRARGSLFRLGAAACLCLALANPAVLNEVRDPVKSVVAVIADRSQSQSIGERSAQTDAALAVLKEKIGRFKQFEMRVVDAGKSGDMEERSTTRLFSSLSEACNRRL